MTCGLKNFKMPFCQNLALKSLNKISTTGIHCLYCLWSMRKVSKVVWTGYHYLLWLVKNEGVGAMSNLLILDVYGLQPCSCATHVSNLLNKVLQWQAQETSLGKVSSWLKAVVNVARGFTSMNFRKPIEKLGWLQFFLLNCELACAFLAIYVLIKVTQVFLARIR